MRSVLRFRALVFVVLAFASGATAAQVLRLDDFAQEDGVGDWTIWWALALGWSWSDADNCLESGSAAAVSWPTPGIGDQLASLRTSCLGLPPGADELFVAMAHRVDEGEVQARIWVKFFADADCATGLLEPQPVSGSSNTEWSTLSGSFVVPVGARAVDLRAEGLRPESSFAFLFDRFTVSLSGPVLLDDFEGGSYCRWSTWVEGGLDGTAVPGD